MMALRILAYMVRVWQRYLIIHPNPTNLPAILPLVLYQGDSQWNAALKFEQLVDPDQRAASSYIPSFQYKLIDLFSLRWEELQGNASARICLELMKAERLKKLIEWIESVGKFWDDLQTVEDSHFLLDLCLRYAFEMEESIDSAEQLDKVISNIEQPDIRSKAMSIAQLLEQKGREEGLQKGTLVGQIQACQRLLKQKVAAENELGVKTDEELNVLLQVLESQLDTRLM